jgi:hypothetical protein
VSVQGVTALIVAVTAMVTAAGTLISHLQLRKKVAAGGGTGVQRTGTSGPGHEGTGTA